MEKILADKRDFLLDRMDPDFGLLDKLIARRIITKEELHNIKLITNTTEAKNKMILDYVLTKSKAQDLIEVLTEMGQIDLVNFLNANGVYAQEFGEDWPLGDTELDRMQVNREALIDLMDPGELSFKLFSSYVINKRQLEFIRSRQTDTEKNDSLLEMMAQFSLRRFNQTITCLHDLNQSHVAYVLSEGGVVVRLHANLEGRGGEGGGGAIKDVDSAEDEIIASMTDLLRNRTATEVNRLFELTQLRLAAVRKGQSIVIYFHSMTLEELLHLNELLISGQLKRKTELDFNHLLYSRKSVEVALTWSQDEFDKYVSYFESLDSFDEASTAAATDSIDDRKKRGLLRQFGKKFRYVFGLKKSTAADETLATQFFEAVQLQSSTWTISSGQSVHTTSSGYGSIASHSSGRTSRESDFKIDCKPDPVLVQMMRTKSAKTENKAIDGLANLDKELFITYSRSSEVEVYDSAKFSFSRRFKLKELIWPWDIGSCGRNKCLYIMNYRGARQSKEILRVEPTGKLIKNWSTGDDVGRLSVTDDSNIILTNKWRNTLSEYSSYGQLIHKIKLSSNASIVHPLHAIKLSNGQCLVSYGGSLHKVCLVDNDGNVQKSFGGEKGSTTEQLNHPEYLAVAKNGSVLVADWGNSRVLLLDSNLKSERELISKGNHGLGYPSRICLDESNGGRLFVADNEWKNRRVFVFDVKF